MDRTDYPDKYNFFELGLSSEFLFGCYHSKMWGKKDYLFAEIRNSIFFKRIRSSYIETMNNGTSLSSSDYETTPKFKKWFGENINAKFDVFMKTRYDLIIEADNKLFKNRTQEPTFFIMFISKISKFKKIVLVRIISAIHFTFKLLKR